MYPENETSALELDTLPEHSIRVAIQGFEGAFHEIAARYFFAPRPIEVVPCETFEALVTAVEGGKSADVGIMAIENTLAGSLMGNYQLLNQSSVRISGEVFLRVKQNLMALPGINISDLREVYSHPIAIAQCTSFFRNYPQIKLIEALDTALSARDVRDSADPQRGAIASELAADLYGLDILAPGIETNKKNHTRFLIIEQHVPVVPPQAGKEKISLSFSVDHEIGSLYQVLGVLSAYQVNLTKIQSTPIIGKPWEYMFFVDFLVEGKFSSTQAIDAIQPLTHDLKVLGTYPEGRHFDH